MSHRSTVLIVDDEVSARDTLEALLFQEGYDLAFASDGAEALKKAMALTPDVILLDVMMPGMDGFEVCRRLRADPLLAEVPVIMVTALEDRESRLQGIQAGADDFVSKPFDGVELRARVRTITRLNRYRRLLTERAKFEWVVERAKEGYLIVNDNDEVLYANPQARLYLDLPADEDVPISKPFLDLARKQYRCEPQESWATWTIGASETPVSTRSPRYLVRPGSPTVNTLWLQVDVMRMLSELSLVHLHDVTTDIVTRNHTWAFHNMVSRKLRTPLDPLVVMLEILEQDVSILSEAGIRHYFLSARESALCLRNRILDVFQYLDALDTSYTVHGRCSLSEISAIIAEIEAGMKLRSIDATCQGIEDPDNTFVPLPRCSVELILWELCENAKKFHPEQSPTLEILISSVPDGAQIQVCDNGVALLPEQLARMWIPYHQGDSDFSVQIPGMGLGLATVASLVWGAGGTCRARNREEGPGVVVELVLPLAKNSGRGRRDR